MGLYITHFFFVLLALAFGLSLLFVIFFAKISLFPRREMQYKMAPFERHALSLTDLAFFRENFATFGGGKKEAAGVFESVDLHYHVRIGS